MTDTSLTARATRAMPASPTAKLHFHTLGQAGHIYVETLTTSAAALDLTSIGMAGKWIDIHVSAQSMGYLFRMPDDFITGTIPVADLAAMTPSVHQCMLLAAGASTGRIFVDPNVPILSYVAAVNGAIMRITQAEF